MLNTSEELYNIGVKRVVFSREMTLKEIFENFPLNNTYSEIIKAKNYNKPLIYRLLIYLLQIGLLIYQLKNFLLY